MAVLGFAAVMVIVHFVLPIACPSVELTLMQSAAITLLAFIGRVVFMEGITVKLDGVDTLEIETREDE